MKMAAENGTKHQHRLRMGPGGVVGASQQIVGAGVVIVRKLDQCPKGKITNPLFVSAVYLQIHSKQAGNPFLCFVMIDTHFINSS